MRMITIHGDTVQNRYRMTSLGKPNLYNIMTKPKTLYRVELTGIDIEMLMLALNSKQVALYELLQEFDKSDPHFELTDSQIELIESIKYRLAGSEEVRHFRAVS